MKRSQTELESIRELDTVYARIADSRMPGKTVVALSHSYLSEDSEHGRALLVTFLRTISDRTLLPDAVLLYGTGVRLATEPGEAAECLARLARLDVAVKASIECLAEYKKEPVVSQIQPVLFDDIVREMLLADKVIRP